MPTQTPASRRFRPPPSTASASAQRHPPFSASQFVRPSQTSSSPFARTPFQSTAQKQRKEEVVADDPLSEDDNAGPGDDDISPTREPLPERPVRFSGKAIEEDELIDDLESSTPFVLTQYTQPSDQRNTQSASTKRRKISHSLSEIIDDDPDLDLPSPPSSPTQSHIDNQTDRPEINVLHTSPDKPQIESKSDADNPQRINPPASPSSSPPPSLPHDLQTPKQKPPRSRFLDTHTQSNQLQSTTPSQIYPSFQSRLLASSTTEHYPTTNSPNPHLRGPRSNLDLTLPDAFSPSRKRGNREYIHGGLAETVRGWVVDMATRAAGGGMGVGVGAGAGSGAGTGSSRATTEGRPNRPSLSEDKIDEKNAMMISEVLLNDPNGRFVLVRSGPTGTNNDTNVAINEHTTDTEDTSQDEDGGLSDQKQTWMLLNTDPQRNPGISYSSTSNSMLTSVVPGRTVVLKGGDTMTWTLKLGLHLNPTLFGSVQSKLDETDSPRCKVAVLWDVR